MKSFTFLAKSESDTDRLAAALAKLLPRRAMIGLIGTLGAGKTRFVQGLAAASGVPRGEVVSPTFVLCQEYSADRELFHFDAYRLADEDEFLALGVEEYFERPGITLVEWSDRVPRVLPAERIEVRIDVVDDTTRRFEITSFGRSLAHLADALSVELP